MLKLSNFYSDEFMNHLWNSFLLLSKTHLIRFFKLITSKISQEGGLKLCHSGRAFVLCAADPRLIQARFPASI